MMDVSAYKDAFISEARDHIDALNENLLVLEKEPANEETINKIFRSFHTLKGNAALMGYTKFSELAHSLEDLLAKVRDKQLAVNANIMDLLLHGCDVLERGLVEITKDNPQNIDSDRVIADLKSLLEKKEKKAVVVIGQAVELTPVEAKAAQDACKEGFNVFRVIITLDGSSVVKGGKALLVLRNAGQVGDLIRTTPQKEEIAAAKFGNEIEFLIATRSPSQEIERVVNGISGIMHTAVTALDDKYVKPAVVTNEEKERAKAEIANEHQAEIVKQVQSVKVDMHRLDKLMNLVGELLISNIRLQDINKKQDYKNLSMILAGVDRLILELQDRVMEVRMVPIGNVFNRFPRMVRDIAEKEGKRVNIIMEGSEIEFDRTVLDQIGEPLVHLLRNCVDHGIETPEKRQKAGKPEEGTIKLLVRRERDNAVIRVEDDGSGIDPKRVKESSVKKGLITAEEAARLSDKDAQMLVFRAGVSTNEVVTEVSGRGVGMDVVLSKVTELGGKVSLDSILGSGTSIVMQLPSTVAIISALLVNIGGETYAIPLSAVDQTVDIRRSQIKTIQGNEVFIFRGTEIPLFWLSSLVGQQQREEQKETATVVVVNKNGEQVGVVVDQILNQQQILTKGLQELVKGTKGCSGATILGDGSVALILDIDTLI